MERGRLLRKPGLAEQESKELRFLDWIGGINGC